MRIFACSAGFSIWRCYPLQAMVVVVESLISAGQYGVLFAASSIQSSAKRTSLMQRSCEITLLCNPPSPMHHFAPQQGGVYSTYPRLKQRLCIYLAMDQQCLRQQKQSPVPERFIILHDECNQCRHQGVRRARRYPEPRKLLG